MKFLIPLILILGFTNPASAQQVQETTIQIIMDDSGVLIDAEEADQFKMQLFSQMKKLVRKREFSKAHIDVISTSTGRTVWSGTPSDLKRQPERALALVNAIKSSPENCNNIPGAFAELSSNLKAIKRQNFKSVHIIVFSSLIDTPRPCDKTTQIVLPQLPPVKANVNAALSSYDTIRSITFFWISPFQKAGWEEYLDPTFNWALQNNIQITFMDIERSKLSLRQGLNFGGRK